MNHPYKLLLFITLLLSSLPSLAQQERLKVAVFTPLYLDSVFDATGKFQYEKTGARFAAPGLDFYYGLQLAIDSLKKRNAPLEVFVYDTRSKETIEQQLAKPELNGVDLFIGHTNPDETRTLAVAAQEKKIPFISATLPNDAGIYNNPYFVILNSTLQAHVEGIYRFLQRYHSLDEVVVLTKKGTQEDRLREYFDDFAKSTAGSKINLRFLEVGTNFSPQSLQPHLDSTQKTVIISGSLDENFGMRLIQVLQALNKTYPVRVIGMPTWESFNYTRFKDLEVIYTTPFFYSMKTTLETHLTRQYNTVMSAKPSDFFYRGYETVLRFGLLLLDTKADMASNLSRKGNTVLTQFDIQPVFKDKTIMELDYFENKHLYFIKLFGGVRNILY